MFDFRDMHWNKVLLKMKKNKVFCYNKTDKRVT